MTEMSGDTRFCKPARNSAASRQPSKLLRETLFTSMTEFCLFLYRALSSPAQHHLKMVLVSLNALRYLGLELREKTCLFSCTSHY